MPDPQIQAIQNLGTALITMGAGSIVDEYDKYEKFTSRIRVSKNMANMIKHTLADLFSRVWKTKTWNLTDFLREPPPCKNPISGMATTG